MNIASCTCTVCYKDAVYSWGGKLYANKEAKLGTCPQVDSVVALQ